MSYPITGFVVGHEIFHGFDYGSTTLEKGEYLRKWLKPKTLAQFQKRARCIVQQYSGYCNKQDKYCLSGGHTLNENIGDMDGIKVAYMAYKFVTGTMGPEPPLPGLEQFTPDQLFFLSAARVWCGTQELEKAYVKMGDVHSPPRARVELSMMNFPAMAQAFTCTVGNKFAPLHTCSLWGDFIEPRLNN